MSETMIELADRCERLVDFETQERVDLNNALHDVLPEPKCVQAPSYHRSIDAAMSLVPEGFAFGCGRGTEEPEVEGWAWCGPHEGPLVFAASPALALCAASLRARAALASLVQAMGE